LQLNTHRGRSAGEFRYIRPAARDDIIRQFRWYLVEQDAPDAALRFPDAVDESVEELLRMPNMGAPQMIEAAGPAPFTDLGIRGGETGIEPVSLIQRVLYKCNV
jgi:plasmid stabilization system protein ParE